MDADLDERVDPLAAGWQALAEGAWADARTAFAAALEREQSAEALEGLAMAAWWLNDVPETFRAREQAYRRYIEAADRLGAARVAVWMATDHFLRRGEHAIGNGWMQRAHRLLEGLDPAPEHAMAAILEAHMAITLGYDTVTARTLSADAMTLARSLGAFDLEMLAQAVNGYARVCEGDIAEGMRLLDEATTAAVAGEMSDIDSIVTTCCYLISACERVRDLDRAAQWCDKVRQFTVRWSYQAMFSYCRTHYAGVLLARGDWQQAETELTAAIDELSATFPAMAVEGVVLLAELRRLQGRLDEAAAQLARLDGHPLQMLGRTPALLGRAGLALDAGDPTQAAELAERYLRAIGPEAWMDRVAALEVLVLAYVARGELDQAAERLHDLVSIATIIPTPSLRASARLAGGVVSHATGDDEEARRRFEDAIDLFEMAGARYQAAHARIELAAVLAALGRTDTAAREARAAHEAMCALGATRAAERAGSLLRHLDDASRAGADNAGNAHPLTQRELEVLRLISRGLSNREAAEALSLSEHTIHRHISNILTKLDLPSRTAAVAHASQHGLL